MNNSDSALIASYLKQLERELEDMPTERRREIVSEIEAHIHEELSQLGHEPSELEISDMLDRIGDPAAIASEASEGPRPPAIRAGALEVIAVILLLVGVFVFWIGWFVGVILLWISPVWKTREKLVGTFVVPGGLGLPLFLAAFFPGTSTSCSIGTTVKVTEGGKHKRVSSGPTVCESSDTTWLWTTVAVVLAVASIASAVYLVRRMRARSALAA